MPPPQTTAAGSTTTAPPENPWCDTRSYHHIIIASLDTRDGIPEIAAVGEALIRGLIGQKRAPTYAVLIPSHGDSEYYNNLLAMARVQMALKGTLVLSCPMGKEGDLEAFKRAVDMLEKDFEANMSAPFDDAWISYFNFPGSIHPDFCRMVFKTVMLSRFDHGETMQVLIFNDMVDEIDSFGNIHEATVTGRCAIKFFRTKLYRLMVAQQNVYWTGIFVMFVRCPTCLDDGIGVTRYKKWPQCRPIVRLALGDRVFFSGHLCRILSVSDEDTVNPKYHVEIEKNDIMKKIELFREEFEVVPRSMRNVNRHLHEERVFKYRERCEGSLLKLSTGVFENILGMLETASEAAMALGACPLLILFYFVACLLMCAQLCRHSYGSARNDK